MEILQRLQPLDILFAVLWAGIIGWGLQTGLLRQLGMLVGVYGARDPGRLGVHAGGQALGLRSASRACRCSSSSPTSCCSWSLSS